MVLIYNTYYIMYFKLFTHFYYHWVIAINCFKVIGYKINIIHLIRFKIIIIYECYTFISANIII